MNKRFNWLTLRRTLGERIVIPTAYLDELKLRPDHEVNNTKALLMVRSGL
jgi:hypothetical protein